MRRTIAEGLGRKPQEYANICAAENPALQDFQSITFLWAVIEYAPITLYINRLIRQ